MSLREAILAAQDIKSEKVTCEDWLGDDGKPVVIEVRTLTGTQRGTIYEDYIDEETGRLDIGRLTPAMVVLASFDPKTGNRVFGDEDVDAVNEKSSKMLEKVGKKALDLSGMSDDAEKRAEKNSKPTPSGASTSSSLKSSA